MAVLTILVVLYAFFGGAYYAYRRGLFGDAGLIAISLLLLTVLGASSWSYLSPARGGAIFETVRASTNLARGPGVVPKIVVSDSTQLK